MQLVAGGAGATGGTGGGGQGGSYDLGGQLLVPGSAGAAATGGGGGGGGYSVGSPGNGAGYAGGSGVAIIWEHSSPLPPPLTFVCSVSNDATVCSVLADLYSATNGASWTNKAGWSAAAAGTSTDYCTFYGATCSSSILASLCVRRVAEHHRIALRRPAFALSHLYENQLSGTIPSSLGSLTGLQNLCVR